MASAIRIGGRVVPRGKTGATPRQKMSEDYKRLVELNYGLPRARPTVPRPGFVRRHKLSVIAVSLAGGAFAATRLDRIPYRPLGQKVPPSGIAFGLTGLLALALDHFKKHAQAEIAATSAVGLALGMIGDRIAEASGGGTR